MDGSGNVITAGSQGYRLIPVGCTLDSIFVVGDVTGTADVVITRDTNYGLSGITAAVVGLAGGQTANYTSGFSASYAQDDMLKFNVTGTPINITQLTVFMNFQQG